MRIVTQFFDRTADKASMNSKLKILIGISFLLAAISPAWGSGGGHADAAAGVTAADAMKMLQDGNKRFVEGKATHAKQDVARRKELANGQKPHTIVLSCSDSRVPPELAFDQGLGELFVIRVAGNVLGAATVASIEYAVEHLGSKLIVVMGHHSCGAVKAAVAAKPGESVGSPDLDTLVASIQPNLQITGRVPAGEEKTLATYVKQNVNGVVQDLRKRSTIVRKQLDGGKLRVVPAVYDLESGVVKFWDASSK
jgi:carbonic anhydrase